MLLVVPAISSGGFLVVRLLYVEKCRLCSAAICRDEKQSRPTLFDPKLRSAPYIGVHFAPLFEGRVPLLPRHTHRYGAPNARRRAGQGGGRRRGGRDGMLSFPGRVARRCFITTARRDVVG